MFGHSFWFPGVPDRQLEVLKKEVTKNCEILSQLPVDLRSTFLRAIKAALKDNDLFEELAQKVSKVLHVARICK